MVLLLTDYARKHLFHGIIEELSELLHAKYLIQCQHIQSAIIKQSIGTALCLDKGQTDSMTVFANAALIVH